MLTIFTTPKPFVGHIGVIQRNAIKSWALLQPQPEIVLFGNDEGAAEVARELALRHIPDLTRNEFGTPLLSDLFHKAENAASFHTLAYVNSDVILLNDFLSAVKVVQHQLPKSLLVSKRINLDIHEPLDFRANWEDALRLLAKTCGVNGHYSSIDAFVFPKGTYTTVPDFAIGRLWFDHWLVKAVRAQELPVIDASLISPLLHQNHDYNHVPGGADQVWRGEETERNFQLYGGVKHAYTLLDVTHELTPAGSVRRVRFRKPIYHLKALAWDILVQRTARLRNAVHLRRRFWQTSPDRTPSLVDDSGDNSR